MPMGLGYQFAPGADAAQQQQGQQGRRGLSPQAAVRLLQLRVPERPAASGIAPQALLHGPGAAGLGGGGGLQAIIQALMSMSGGMPGAMSPSAAPGGGGMPTAAGAPAPAPRVIPGVGGPNSEPNPPSISSPFDIDPALHDRILDTDLGGGRTLRKGGGFGGHEMRDHPVQIPPLF